MTGREPAGRIITCPFCGLSFMEGIETVRRKNRLCMVCGYTWESKGDRLPRRCPKCRSTEWNVSERRAVECVRCGHRWVPRGGHVPKKCPHCKSPDWKGKRIAAEERGKEALRKALAMYAGGSGCIEACKETGVPLETLVLKILSLGEETLRFTSEERTERLG